MFNIEVDILFYVPTKSILKETRSMPRSISVPNISMKTHIEIYETLGVGDFCLTPNEQVFRYILTITSFILMRWWRWCPLCSRPTNWVCFIVLAHWTNSPREGGMFIAPLGHKRQDLSIKSVKVKPSQNDWAFIKQYQGPHIITWQDLNQ
jgi:hypothetical protein